MVQIVVCVQGGKYDGWFIEVDCGGWDWTFFFEGLWLYTNRAVTQINHESKIPVLAEKSELVCTVFESIESLLNFSRKNLSWAGPDVHKLAYLRWFVLVLVGWIHFCF